MEGPIEEKYFNWLCAKVLVNYTVPTYLGLMRMLHSTEFVPIVPGDENRAADGIELRLYFFSEAFIKKDQELMEEPCSLLEMFVAFANRAAFQTEMPVHEWFWIIMGNLGLDVFQRVTSDDEQIVKDILVTFINREYEYNGTGGMFPLRNPIYDQREVEIWYQFCEYVEDQGLL